MSVGEMCMPRHPEIEVDLNKAPIDETGRASYVVKELEEAGIDATAFRDAARGLHPTVLLELMTTWVSIK